MNPNAFNASRSRSPGSPLAARPSLWRVPAAGLEQLAPLGKLSQLGLAYTKITNQGMATLKVRAWGREFLAPPLPSGRQLGDERTLPARGTGGCDRRGAFSRPPCLADAQSFPLLTLLNLDSCQVSDAGCKVSCRRRQRHGSVTGPCTVRRTPSGCAAALAPGSAAPPSFPTSILAC